MIPAGPHARGPQTADAGLLCAATAALVRLDERLGAAAAVATAVAEGWRARALVHEAAASVRLAGRVVDAGELLLFDGDALDRLPDPDLAEAVRLLALLRAAARRRPGRLFTPLRLIALARPRLASRTAAARPDGLDWLFDRLGEPETARRCLEDALSPPALSAWRRQPPLVASAALLARWHESGAAEALGGFAGRMLAGAWPARVGLTAGPILMPSLGFLGHAAAYRPGASAAWTDGFLAASLRAADWGLELHRRLAAGHARLQAATRPQRRTSRLPALAELLVARPTVTPAAAARSLGLSATAARQMLDALHREGLCRELSNRGSFRVFAL